ncbi:unnamed protein product, partial [Closterium sp. NIES-54]
MSRCHGSGSSGGGAPRVCRRHHSARRGGELHGGLHSPHRGPPHNPAKCEAWSATALDPATLHPGITISLDSVRVLGSPIGPPSGCAARVSERLSAAVEPLPLLSQMDPQLCLLLLTRCVSRRASFLVRTTPLEALPLGEWSAWGEDLLHTYLVAAHTTIPRDRAERDRIWHQAALPASLGGLGITNPAVEGGFAYLASVVSAAHLLHSFGDSANPALTGLLPLMDADGESISLLPRRLAALEAELPPDGIEALQVGRQKPNGPKLQQALSLAVHTARFIRLLDSSRIMELDPMCGHMQRLQSLLGPGAGDWLLVVPLISSLRLGPSQFSTAASFRLGLPLPVPRRCNCRYRTTFPDDRLQNHLMRCEKEGERIATHHALRDEFTKIAAEAGFTVHKETTAYSPVENLKADISIRHPDTGEVWICDITVTVPVSHEDVHARKAPGWAARMQADTESKYAGRSAWVGFYAMAVETYGYPSPGVLDFLGRRNRTSFPAPDPHLSAPFAVFSKVLESCEMGVGAGPSGTTFEHLRDAALINHSVGNTILTGKLPPVVAELLTAERLIALSKPDGGTRPIAIGKSITRLAAKTALTLTAGAAREFFLPHQFGVAVPGRAEAIIHITRTYLTVNTGALVLQADLAIAFNSVNRAAIIASLRGSTLASL